MTILHDLTLEIERLQALEAGAAEVLVDRDRALADLAAANARLANAAAEYATLERDTTAHIDHLEDEVARLTALLDNQPPPPPPPVRTTRYGACPGSTGGAAGVVSKYGPGVAVRQFISAGLSTVPTRPAGISVFHVSWKPLGGPALTDATVTAACRNLVKGDKVTVEHEHDVKHRNGGSASQLAERIALIEQFHSIVKRVRPDLTTVCVMGGWRFHPTNGADDSPDPYVAKSDVLGVDFDGTRTYTDWPICIPEVKRIADAHYGGRWTVPEFGWPVMADDPNRTGRLAAIARQVPIIANAGAEEIQLFDIALNGVPYPLTTQAEIAAWKAYVAG